MWIFIAPWKYYVGHCISFSLKYFIFSIEKKYEKRVFFKYCTLNLIDRWNMCNAGNSGTLLLSFIKIKSLYWLILFMLSCSAWELIIVLLMILGLKLFHDLWQRNESCTCSRKEILSHMHILVFINSMFSTFTLWLNLLMYKMYIICFPPHRESYVDIHLVFFQWTKFVCELLNLFMTDNCFFSNELCEKGHNLTYEYNMHSESIKLCLFLF